jgi:hypothetical protein
VDFTIDVRRRVGIHLNECRTENLAVDLMNVVNYPDLPCGGEATGMEGKVVIAW